MQANKEKYEEPDFDDELLDESLDNLDLSDDGEEIKKGTPISNDLEDLIDEHEEIVSTLRNGSKGEILDLADEQEQELFEYQNRLKNSYGRARSTMPQIDEEVLDEYLIHHAEKGLVKKVTRKLTDLIPTQNEINEDKILEKIQDFSTNFKERKYIISNDNYILDGHHDWAHGLEEDPDCEVTCYRINLPIGELLRRSNLMKISKQRDLYDNISKCIIYEDLYKSIKDDLIEMKKDFLEKNKLGISYLNILEYLQNENEDLATKENCMIFLNFIKNEEI